MNPNFNYIFIKNYWMIKLRILLNPMNHYPDIYLNDKICNRIDNIVKKFKPGWANCIWKYTENGFTGMELLIEKGISLFVNEQNIIYIKDNTFEMFYDSKKILYNIIINNTIEKYYDEMKYYLEVTYYKKMNNKK